MSASLHSILRAVQTTHSYRELHRVQLIIREIEPLYCLALRVRCLRAASTPFLLADARRLDLEEEVVVRIIPVELALELSTRAKSTWHGPTRFIERQRVAERDRDDQTANAALRHPDDALVETGDRAAVAYLLVARTVR